LDFLTHRQARENQHHDFLQGKQALTFPSTQASLAVNSFVFSSQKNNKKNQLTLTTK
jgi:hypothetical protein